jgi:hypothetical protein
VDEDHGGANQRDTQTAEPCQGWNGGLPVDTGRDCILKQDKAALAGSGCLKHEFTVGNITSIQGTTRLIRAHCYE